MSFCLGTIHVWVCLCEKHTMQVNVSLFTLIVAYFSKAGASFSVASVIDFLSKGLNGVSGDKSPWCCCHVADWLSNVKSRELGTTVISATSAMYIHNVNKKDPLHHISKFYLVQSLFVAFLWSFLQYKHLLHQRQCVITSAQVEDSVLDDVVSWCAWARFGVKVFLQH